MTKTQANEASSRIASSWESPKSGNKKPMVVGDVDQLLLTARLRLESCGADTYINNP